jgi:BMFP domain-containing protein YqiC
MQTSNRLFDDIARIAGGAFQTITGLREEIELRVKERVERMLADLDLVTREEHDAVKAMAAKARGEQDKLADKVAGLEREVAALKGGKPASRPRRAPSRPRKAKPADATG